MDSFPEVNAPSYQLGFPRVGEENAPPPDRGNVTQHMLEVQRRNAELEEKKRNLEFERQKLEEENFHLRSQLSDRIAEDAGEDPLTYPDRYSAFKVGSRLALNEHYDEIVQAILETLEKLNSALPDCPKESEGYQFIEVSEKDSSRGHASFLQRLGYWLYVSSLPDTTSRQIEGGFVMVEMRPMKVSYFQLLSQLKELVAQLPLEVRDQVLSSYEVDGRYQSQDDADFTREMLDFELVDGKDLEEAQFPSWWQWSWRRCKEGFSYAENTYDQANTAYSKSCKILGIAKIALAFTAGPEWGALSIAAYLLTGAKPRTSWFY